MDKWCLLLFDTQCNFWWIWSYKLWWLVVARRNGAEFQGFQL